MNCNYFCHICGGLVDLIKLQPSGARFCECSKRFEQLRAENSALKSELAEAKKDAELWREREAKIKSLRERGFLGSPLRGEPYKVDMKGK